MQRRIGIASVVFTLLGVGFDLAVDAFGSRTVIAQALPILGAFVPGLAFGAIVAGVYGLWLAVQSWGERRCIRIIDDLCTYAGALDLAERPYKPVGEPPDVMRQARRARDLLAAKYAHWLDPGLKLRPGETTQDRATHVAEVFRIHGYFAGRRLLRKTRPWRLP